MSKERPPLIKFTSNLYRITQSYSDEAMKKYGLSSGTYPFLLMLNEEEGVSQSRVCKEVNVDKAMATRSINKLVELGYVKKENDEIDTRAYKLYLTDEAKAIIPELRLIMREWVDIITDDFDEVEKDMIVKLTEKAAMNAKRYKESKLIEDDKNE